MKLADFGSAKLLSKTMMEASVCAQFTVPWMSPEYAAGEYTSKSDIWSLACVVIEMATCSRPWAERAFDSESELNGRDFIANTTTHPTLPSPQTFSEEGRDFLKLCFQINPDERPSAIQLLEHPFITAVSVVSPSASISESAATETIEIDLSELATTCPLSSPSSFTANDASSTTMSMAVDDLIVSLEDAGLGPQIQNAKPAASDSPTNDSVNSGSSAEASTHAGTPNFLPANPVPSPVGISISAAGSPDQSKSTLVAKRMLDCTNAPTVQTVPIRNLTTAPTDVSRPPSHLPNPCPPPNQNLFSHRTPTRQMIDDGRLIRSKISNIARRRAGNLPSHSFNASQLQFGRLEFCPNNHDLSGKETGGLCFPSTPEKRPPNHLGAGLLSQYGIEKDSQAPPLPAYVVSPFKANFKSASEGKYPKEINYARSHV